LAWDPRIKGYKRNQGDNLNISQQTADIGSKQRDTERERKIELERFRERAVNSYLGPHGILKSQEDQGGQGCQDLSPTSQQKAYHYC
jgi:hypothetical protein